MRGVRRPRRRLAIHFPAVTTIWRLGYRAVYAAARVWWFVRRPHTRGAVVAVWQGGRVLLVKSSYRAAIGLPGGFVKAGESSRTAAVRELAEEVHVTIAPEALVTAWHGTLAFEHRQDDVTIWEVTLNARPAVQVDGREVVWHGWESPAEALTRDLLPHVREYLSARL